MSKDSIIFVVFLQSKLEKNKMIGIIAMAMMAVPQVDTLAAEPKVITLEQALEIALNSNASVKVAEMEVKKTGYARRGTYSSLFPTIDGTASFQRTIKKQKMYMDVAGMEDGMEVGRLNNWSAGLSASMPLVNAQLWKTLKVSDMDVELSVEKARSSRLETVNQVKQTFFAVLLAKEAAAVYASVYENAKENLELTQKKYNAQRASELDLARAKTSLANAIPNLFDSENSIQLTLWQLKAVMGVDLNEDIDVAGTLLDLSGDLLAGIGSEDVSSLDRNSTMKQLSIQAEQLAANIKLQQYASIPSLSLGYSFAINAMANDFTFSQYNWSPYSYVGISLNIPIFAGGKRYYSAKQAKVQAAELSIQREDTERQLRIAIQQYINTMDTATKSFVSSESAVESATKAYSIAKQSYSVGRSTLTDLNDAQLALTQAELTVCQAIYSYVVAKANLEGTLGYDFTNRN